MITVWNSELKQIVTVILLTGMESAACAQFPTKPVRIIAASTGTSGDLLARYLGQRLSERWSQPVVVKSLRCGRCHRGRNRGEGGARWLHSASGSTWFVCCRAESLQKTLVRSAKKFRADHVLRACAADYHGTSISAANLDVGRLPPDTAYDMGLKLDCPAAQAIVLAGTNWRTIAIIEKLEAKIGKPVIATTAAALWSALRIVGWRGALAGQGRLLNNI